MSPYSDTRSDSELAWVNSRISGTKQSDAKETKATKHVIFDCTTLRKIDAVTMKI